MDRLIIKRGDAVNDFGQRFIGAESSALVNALSFPGQSVPQFVFYLAVTAGLNKLALRHRDEASS